VVTSVFSMNSLVCWPDGRRFDRWLYAPRPLRISRWIFSRTSASIRAASFEGAGHGIVRITARGVPCQCLKMDANRWVGASGTWASCSPRRGQREPATRGVRGPSS